MSKDELLREAVEAHEAVVDLDSRVKQARQDRAKAFKRALASSLTARELGEATGMSGSQAANISRG